MRSFPSDWRGRAILVAVAVVLGAGLYFGGRWQERGRARIAAEATQARLDEATQEGERVRAELAAAQARLGLVEARALLFEVALDLERRNFGTANGRLDTVSTRLESAPGASGVADEAALQALRQEVGAMDLRVAENLAEQRARVLDLAARLGALLQASR